MRQMDVEVQKMLEGRQTASGGGRQGAEAVGSRVLARRRSRTPERRARCRASPCSSGSAAPLDASQSLAKRTHPADGDLSRDCASTKPRRISSMAPSCRTRHGTAGRRLSLRRAGDRCSSVLLMLFPMVMVFRYSLMDGAIMKPDAAFVGLQNYPADLRRSGVLAVDRQHALFHDHERDLPPPHRPGLRAAAELEARQSAAHAASCGCSTSCPGCSPP